MLTFSRSAATEFKQRLRKLVGDAANYVEIKTFHSYCFDLLGRIGNLEDAVGVVRKASEMILSDEVEPNRISKTVLVIDEAQDMSADEFALVSALMEKNEEIRVIAVGDDDQNIYEFRGSSSEYLRDLCHLPESRFIESTPMSLTPSPSVTTMLPCGREISSPAPIAAATGSSMR